MTKDEVIAYQAEKLLSISIELKELNNIAIELQRIYYDLIRLEDSPLSTVYEARSTRDLVQRTETSVGRVIKIIKDKD